MRLFLAAMALSATMVAPSAQALDVNDALSQKIIAQGVPTDALTRFYKFIDENKGRQFHEKVYDCLGRYFGTVKPCDENARLPSMKDVTFNEIPNYVGIIDFTRPSTERRFFLINMKSGEVKKYYVAHGKGSGAKYATKFSNTPDSLQTSLGIYLGGEVYQGSYGDTLRLYGLEGSNDKAYNRDIVLHGAWYVGEDFINSINDSTKQKYDRLGVSWGCPALSLEIAPKVIALLKNGGLLMHYQKDLMDKSESGQEVSIPTPLDPAHIPIPTPRPKDL